MDLIGITRECDARDEVLDNTESFMLKYGSYFEPSIKYLSWYNKVDAMTSNYKLILVHPGAGKSTRLKWEAIRRLCQNRKYKVAYISKSSKKAALFMDSLGRELKENKRLIKDFGEFYEHGNQWNSEAIKIKGSGADPTPSISNYGATSQIEGMRPNMIILDDPIDINTILSPADCLSMEQRITPWLQRLHIANDSEFWVIGHRFTPNDLYRYIEGNPAFQTLVLPAYDIDKNLLVPEFWDWEQFEKMIVVSHKDWELRAHYLQELISPENCSLKWEWLEKNIVSPAYTEIASFTAVADPATSADRKADYSVVVCGGKYKDGVIITGVQRWRISSGWEREFIACANRHKCADLYIETNNTATLHESTQAFANQNGIPIRVHGFKTTERDKSFRMGTLEVPAREGKIYIHRDVLEMEAFQELKAQWTLYPNLAHDDVLDAMEMLVTRIKGGGYGATHVDKRRLFG